MKKRKKPILLVTILIVLVAIVVGMNYRPSTGDPEQAPPPSAEAQPGAPRNNTPSSTDLMKKSQSALSGGSPQPPSSPAGRARAMGVPEGAMPPSVENPSAGANYKPQPSDSSISTQWYTDEAKK